MSRRRCSFLLLGIALACGDSLVDGDYAGEPLFRLSGVITVDHEFSFRPDVQEGGELRIALFWALRGDDSDTQSPQFLLENQVVTRGSFPARYELRVFSPPDPETLGSVFQGDITGYGKIAVGAMLMYIDRNANQRWDRDHEMLVGGAIDGKMVVYTPDGAGSGRVPWTLEPGFSVMRVVGSFCLEESGESEFGESTNGLFPLDVEERNIDLLVAGWDIGLLEDVDCDGNLLEWEPCASHAALECEDEAFRLDEDPRDICPELAYCFEWLDDFENEEGPGEEHEEPPDEEHEDPEETWDPEPEPNGEGG